jgi:AcrR family transcriptional regulator
VAETKTVDRSSERRHIIDAAYRCLDRNAGSSASITEILDEAGLGTRAFYRNFGTKGDLLLEMFRRDRETVLAQLREIVARAESPIDALRLWMTHMFDIISDPRRRKRMATFYSDEMRRTPGYPRELELFATAEEAALAAILHRGKAEGAFTACSPESDARSIRAAFEAAFLDRFNQKSTTSVAEDVEQLLGFVLRGLGAVDSVGAERISSNKGQAQAR